MLKKPYAGWSHIDLLDFNMEVSYNYSGNAPFNWLFACKHGLDYHLPAALLFDSEGYGEVVVVADECHTSILYTDIAEMSLITVSEEYNLMNLTEELVMDINRDFDSWVKEWIAEPINPYLSSEEREYMNMLHWQGCYYRETERMEERLKTALRETESSWLKRTWRENNKI